LGAAARGKNPREARRRRLNRQRKALAPGARAQGGAGARGCGRREMQRAAGSARVPEEGDDRRVPPVGESQEEEAEEWAGWANWLRSTRPRV
jgi:hypothetical protein